MLENAIWSCLSKPFPPLTHGFSTRRRRLGPFFSLTVVRCRCFLASSSGKRTPLTPGASSFRSQKSGHRGHRNKTEEKNCLVSRHLPYQFIWPQSCCALLNHQLFPEGHPLAVFLDLCCHLHPLLGSLHRHQSPNTWLYLGCPGKKNNHNCASPIYLVGRTCRFSTPWPRANVGPCPSGFPWARWVCPPIP